LPDVFALAINEQIPDAAHVAIVEQSSPHLSREDKASFIFWQAPKVQFIIQVQNLTLARSRVGCAQGVDRNGTCYKTREYRGLYKAEHHLIVTSSLSAADSELLRADILYYSFYSQCLVLSGRIKTITKLSNFRNKTDCT
jgi:hypothetical protein